jgi:hypothetical protein
MCGSPALTARTISTRMGQVHLRRRTIPMKFRSLIALLGVFGVLSAPVVYAQKESHDPTTKKMPMRDPKTGKFIKKMDAHKTGVVAKKMPLRDPKTGKFMKVSVMKEAPISSKKMPMRDPKTGKFIKQMDAHNMGTTAPEKKKK